MSSTSSISNDSNKQPVSPTAAPAPATAADLVPKDNLSRQDSLVVLTNSTLAPELDITEQPEIATPEQFRSKKTLFAPKDLPDYFLLLATQQKKDLEQKRDNMETRQKSAAAIQEAKKQSNLDTDKKINEQAESQQKSNAKSGFLSIFTKVFSAITFVIGAAMMFVPGLQGLGVALMVTSAIAFATSFPEVMKALGDAFTAMLTPIMGQEAAKQWGPIIAAFFVAATQIAIMLVVPNPAQIVSAVKNGLTAMKTIAGMKTVSTGAQVTQSAVSGGVGMGLGVNNLKLADITNALDKITASSELYSTQLTNLIEALNKDYQNMSDSIRKYVQQIDDTPKIAIA